jgi:uncharacterized protein (TIGR02118 family)
MVRTLVLYGHPTDPAAFDRYYADVHAPLAAKIPGLRSFQVSRGPLTAPEGDAPYHLVAQLDFDDQDAAVAGMSSPEGAAAVADVANFATGPVTILSYEVDAVALPAAA